MSEKKTFEQLVHEMTDSQIQQLINESTKLLNSHVQTADELREQLKVYYNEKHSRMLR